MAQRWYLCPYDTVQRPDGEPGRTCSMHRHVPSVARGGPVRWQETEVLGNHVVVLLDAPDDVHERVAADPDFTEVSEDNIDALDARMAGLGYTPREIEEGLSRQSYLAVLTAARSVVTVKRDKSGFDVAAQRLPTRKAEDIDPTLKG